MQMQLTEYMDKTGITGRIIEGLMKLTDEDRALDMWETLDDWTILSNGRPTSRTGQCNYRKKKIEVHAELLKEGREDARNQTSIHEIAHVVTHLIYNRRNVSGHGREWKSVMKAFGVRPDRCSNHDFMNEVRLKKAKHIYACDRCEKEFPAMRKKKYPAYRYSHKGCPGRFYLKSSRK